MRFQDLPIRRKFVGAILLISISVLVVAAVVMLAYEFRNSRRDMASELSAVAEIIAANSSAVLVFDDPKLANEILSGLRVEPEVVAAALYDKSGKLYVRYPAEVSEADLPQVPGGDGQQFHRDYFALYTAVYEKEQRVGTLYLRADYRRLYHRLTIYIGMLLIVLAGAGTMAFFLSNLFESRISRPLLELAQTARAVSEQKDYSVRAVKTSKDELGLLTDAFNLMLAQIQSSDATLREREERFAQFMQHLPGLAWIKDQEGRYIYVNDAAASVFRVPRERLYGKTDDEVFLPQVAVRFKANDREALASGAGVQVVEALQHQDGTLHHSIVNKFPIPGPDGRSMLVGGMAIDISDRKRAEEALLRSEEKFRSIFEGAAVSLWEEDFSAVKAALDGLKAQGVTDFRQYLDAHPEFVREAMGRIRVLDVNETTVQMFEAEDKTELLGSLPKIFPPESMGVLVQELITVAEGGTYMQGEAVLHTLRGNRINTLFTMTLPRGSQEFDRVLFSLVDVTGRKQAEETRSRLAAIVESSQDAIVSKTLQGIIRTWNRGAERVFGYTAAEAVGRSITMLIPLDRLAEEEDILTRQRRGESIENYETIRVRKDGTQIDVSLTISPVRDARGVIVGISKVARDITEKKRAERDLERARDAAEAANRAKDDFLAALSHELRTPLQPVMITISMLQQDRSMSPYLAESLAVVRRNIEIQSRMINDLLDLSRIRANKLELHLEITDLHEIVRRAMEVCRSNKKFKDLNITMKLDAAQHYVRADADRLQQVFWNLIQNAMKFTPAGGRIAILSRNRNGSVNVTVLDNGVGIDSDVLGKIFEPFEQGGRKSKESLQGLGLGLAIARRIVLAHGGTLVAASDGKNRGAVFTLELEVVPNAAIGESASAGKLEFANPEI